MEEIARNIREAIELHLEGMLEDGEPAIVCSADGQTTKDDGLPHG